MKVYVLDHSHYKTQDGNVIETHSRPTEPAPDGRFDSPKYGWHDVLCRWLPLEKLNEPCVAEIGD